MNSFIATAASRETSVELMQAIAQIARDESEAVRIWEEPSAAELHSIWEIVTGNGLRDGADYCWGVEGSNWSAGFVTTFEDTSPFAGVIEFHTGNEEIRAIDEGESLGIYSKQDGSFVRQGTIQKPASMTPRAIFDAWTEQ